MYGSYDNSLPYGMFSINFVCVCIVIYTISRSWCSQTCYNDHLYNTATCLRQLHLGSPNVICGHLLLYKATTCYTRPATTFFYFPEKAISVQYAPIFSSQKQKPNIPIFSTTKECLVKDLHLHHSLHNLKTRELEKFQMVSCIPKVVVKTERRQRLDILQV